VVPSVNTVPGERPTEKGKPVARRGRKATGLTEVAGLPTRRWAVEVQISPRMRVVAYVALNLGLAVALLFGAAASFRG
jgi:hypothetical protein